MYWPFGGVVTAPRPLPSSHGLLHLHSAHPSHLTPYLPLHLPLPSLEEEKKRSLIFCHVRGKLPHAYTAVCVCAHTIFSNPPSHLLPFWPANRDWWGVRAMFGVHDCYSMTPAPLPCQRASLTSRRVMRNRAKAHFEAHFSACVHMHVCHAGHKKQGIVKKIKKKKTSSAV